MTPASTRPETLTLPELARELRARGVPLSRDQLWRRVASGAIPAERGPRCWTVQACDVPRIVAALAA